MTNLQDGKKKLLNFTLKETAGAFRSLCPDVIDQIRPESSSLCFFKVGWFVKLHTRLKAYVVWRQNKLKNGGGRHQKDGVEYAYKTNRKLLNSMVKKPWFYAKIGNKQFILKTHANPLFIYFKVFLVVFKLWFLTQIKNISNQIKKTCVVF